MQIILLKDIKQLQKQTGYELTRILKMFEISKSSHHRWQHNEENEVVNRRRDLYSLLEDEKLAILNFRTQHSEVGYRKLSYMLIDANVAYASESSIYRLLKENGRLGYWNQVDSKETSKEYQHKPKFVHEHWHIDIAYIKVGDVFYFLIMVIDGYSRFLLNWELLTDMLTSSVNDFIQQTKDKYPNAKPRLISDNGPQFVSRDFKQLVARLEIEKVYTRRNHPQTNGKIERLNKTAKNEGLRPRSPMTFVEAKQAMEDFVYFYNYQRLHAGVQYLRPSDLFFGRDKDIINERMLKLANARRLRKEVNSIKNSPLFTTSKSPN